tara:strand:- start:290 stop:583 length:294 start_codon:yes stop_codon:yes gene_type:complete
VEEEENVEERIPETRVEVDEENDELENGRSFLEEGTLVNGMKLEVNWEIQEETRVRIKEIVSSMEERRMVEGTVGERVEKSVVEVEETEWRIENFEI